MSLFQVSVGMATVLLLGTLNRVMIVELSLAASLVAIMIALPVLIAPFRAFSGVPVGQSPLCHWLEAQYRICGSGHSGSSGALRSCRLR